MLKNIIILVVLCLVLGKQSYGQNTGLVDFSSSQTYGCAPIVIAFTDKTPSATKWFWVFDNGNESTEQNPSTIFGVGKYTVSLTAWDEGGRLLGTSRRTINSYASPEIKFSVAEDKNCESATLTLSASNKIGTAIARYFWNLGNGTSTNSSKATIHTKESSRHTIKLKVVDIRGCESSSQTTQSIELNEVGEVSITPTEVYACPFPKNIEFAATHKKILTNHRWVVDNKDTFYAAKPNYTLRKTGNTQVSFTAKTEDGCAIRFDTTLLASDLSEVTPQLNRQFMCKPGLVIASYPLPANADVKTICNWDFGDGTPNVIANDISHTYEEAGLYEVFVQYRVGGCRRNKRFQVEVLDEDPPLFESAISQAGSCKPSTVKLWSDYYNTANYWTIQRDTIAASEDTLYATFPTDYFVAYHYFYGEGDKCSDSIVYQIKDKTIDFKPKSSCQGDPCLSFSYDFVSNQINGDSCFLEWYVNDSLVSTKAKFSFTFSERGGHSVKFFAKSIDGCVVQKDLSVNIPEKLKGFEVASDVYYKECPPAICKFTINSKDQVGISSVYWDFGNNSHSQHRNTQGFYDKPGKYTVGVEVEHSNGCKMKKVMKDFISVGGPTGKWSVKDKKGCVPLQPQFEVSALENVSFYWLDYGDGKGVQGNALGRYTYDYTLPKSSFHTRLVLVDSNGCRNQLQNEEIITYEKLNILDIQIDGKCSNEIVRAKAFSVDQNNAVHFDWFLNGKNFGNRENLVLDPLPRGKHTVGVQAANSDGCTDTFKKQFEIYHIEAAIDKRADSICMGDEVRFEQKAKADMSILEHLWYVDDTLLSSGYVLSEALHTPGVKSLKYVVNDVMGCSDSIEINEAIWVGDTTEQQVKLSVVSTLNEQANRIVFEPVNEDDFRSYHIYEVDHDTATVARVYDAKTSNFVHDVETLGRSRCYSVGVQNLCNTPIEVSKLKKHCTIELQTTPDTNQVMLSWTRYKGRNDVSAYMVSRKEQGSNMSHFYLVAKEDSTYLDTQMSCHTTYDYKVSAKFWGDTLRSFSNEKSENPPFKNDLPISYPFLVSLNDSATRLELSYTNDFASLTSNLDSVSYTVSTREKLMLKDKNKLEKHLVISHSIPTDRVLFIQSKFTNECGEVGEHTQECNTMMCKAVLNQDNKVVVTWNRYEYWPNGEEKYIVQRSLDGHTFQNIGDAYQYTTFVDENVYDRCTKVLLYRVVAVANQAKVGNHTIDNAVRSFSNITTLQSKPLVYIPTAFTPNEDGLNEVFSPVASFYTNAELIIYNSYGQKIHLHSGCEPFWDGTIQGEKAQNGAYLYTLKVDGVDGKRYTYSGVVSLIF